MVEPGCRETVRLLELKSNEVWGKEDPLWAACPYGMKEGAVIGWCLGI